jgi:hypothetical protein
LDETQDLQQEMKQPEMQMKNRAQHDLGDLDVGFLILCEVGFWLEHVCDGRLGLAQLLWRRRVVRPQWFSAYGHRQYDLHSDSQVNVEAFR